jgi:hypothetical protein
MSRPSRRVFWALAASFVFLSACAYMAPLIAMRDQFNRGLGEAGFSPPGTLAVATPYPTAPASGAQYMFTFDSKMTTIVNPGVERIRARVSLHPREGSYELIGEAPVEIVSADGDNQSGGACRKNSFKEVPGVLRVLYGKVDRDASGDFTSIKLIYTLDPEIVCTVDDHFAPNQWNLFWMVYDGHFTHTDDTLDDSGPEPLITVGHWHFNGPSATRVYQWSSDAVAEDTTITLNPIAP